MNLLQHVTTATRLCRSAPCTAAMLPLLMQSCQAFGVGVNRWVGHLVVAATVVVCCDATESELKLLQLELR